MAQATPTGNTAGAPSCRRDDGYGGSLEGRARLPVEVDRLPATGDGEGQEVLYNRRHYILHPRGIDFVGGTVAGKSPTNAEYALAGNWNRVYQRKSCRWAYLKTNG